MHLGSLRPIRLAGWAFQLSVPNHRFFPLLKAWRAVLFLMILACAQVMGMPLSQAQHAADDHDTSHEAVSAHEQHDAHAGSGWEGSAAGIAYSVFNHRLAGLFILLIGLSEMGHALRSHSPWWTRLVLPGALGGIGIFLLVWSDHEAWPIGPLTFAQTFFGQDHEIVQHKFYGVFASAVAMSEMLRRMEWAMHPSWAAPLPIFAVIGGLMLFVHSHGVHPAGHQIELHHAIMGGMAVSAGVAKSATAGLTGSSRRSARGWELVWAGLILLIGVQLLVYSE